MPFGGPPRDARTLISRLDVGRSMEIHRRLNRRGVLASGRRDATLRANVFAAASLHWNGEFVGPTPLPAIEPLTPDPEWRGNSRTTVRGPTCEPSRADEESA